jgi:hypothetical protein
MLYRKIRCFFLNFFLYFQALGVKSQKDRDIIKTKVKDMKADDKKRFKMLLENTTKKKKLKT